MSRRLSRTMSKRAMPGETESAHGHRRFSVKAVKPPGATRLPKRRPLPSGDSSSSSSAVLCGCTIADDCDDRASTSSSIVKNNAAQKCSAATSRAAGGCSPSKEKPEAWPEVVRFPVAVGDTQSQPLCKKQRRQALPSMHRKRMIRAPGRRRTPRAACARRLHSMPCCGEPLLEADQAAPSRSPFAFSAKRQIEAPPGNRPGSSRSRQPARWCRSWRQPRFCGQFQRGPAPDKWRRRSRWRAVSAQAPAPRGQDRRTQDSSAPARQWLSSLAASLLERGRETFSGAVECRPHPARPEPLPARSPQRPPFRQRAR